MRFRIPGLTRAMRVQMLGLCRFSYLGGAGYQVRHDTIEARRAFLYDPDRLARRWFWFENVVLPPLLAQTDPDFTLVLMTGPDLPEPYLSHLRELTGIAPQFRLSLIPPMDEHTDACLAATVAHIDPRADVVGHFRQDDDDAVAVDYVERARSDFAMLRALWQVKQRLYCDYSRGLVLKATQDGVTVEPRIIHHAVAAMTVYLAPDAGRSVVHFPHWKIATAMPGVNMAEQVMYARVLNHDNDSGAIGAGYPLDKSRLNPRGMLVRRFRIHLPTLEDGARDFGLPGAPRPNWGR